MRDFDEVVPNVKEGLDVHFVDDYMQIFSLAFSDDQACMEKRGVGVGVSMEKCLDPLHSAKDAQVCNAFTAMENLSPCKRLLDGSKRVRVPHFLNGELPDDGKM